jgi:hypothetical protein
VPANGAAAECETAPYGGDIKDKITLSPPNSIMATIKARRQANRSIRYTAIVRKRVDKTIRHREAKTFTHRAAAITWAKHREVELENHGVLGRKQDVVIALAELIRWYIETFETISKWQRSKQSHLEFLARHTIGQANVFELTPAALIKHVQARRADGAGPATVINDLVWIGVVLRAAQTVQDLPVRPESVQEARDACGELRLIGKARKRARRPTTDELTRLREFFYPPGCSGRHSHGGHHGCCDRLGATPGGDLSSRVDRQ